MSVRAIDSASKIPQVMVESKSNVSTQPTSPSQDTDCSMNCFSFGEDQLDHHGHRTKVTSGTGLPPRTRHPRKKRHQRSTRASSEEKNAGKEIAAHSLPRIKVSP